MPQKSLEVKRFNEIRQAAQTSLLVALLIATTSIQLVSSRSLLGRPSKRSPALVM